MIDTAQALDFLRAIIAAYTRGDADELERQIESAGEWLGELDGESVKTKKSGPAAEEEGAVRPARSSVVDPKGASDAGAALVRLYNAASRLLSQGPSTSATSELEAAVRAAAPFVVR